MTAVVRTLAVREPDWPLTAAGISPDVPAAVLVAGKISASTPAARAAGVVAGLRRRDAQSRCPELELVPVDPARDARVFEPVVAAVEAVVPGVEVVRPGLCVVASRGAARYFGGDDPLVAEVRASVLNRTGVHCRVGVADGPFAAVLAARAGLVVPPGGTGDFLAPLPVELLGQSELADLLRRLGLPTLGDLARLPAAEVLARLGPAGAHAHHLARGRDERAPLPRDLPLDLAVSRELDPPAERAEAAIFAARRLSEQVSERLAAAGLSCSRILIEAQTEHGERFSRAWRHDGPLTTAAITDRLRWQLDGWLSGTAGAEAPTAGVTLLRIVPDELVPAGGRQLGLWGDPGAAAARVGRALARVQGMLGPDAVATPEIGGGRNPADQVRLVPWGEPRAGGDADALPWPGRLPGPAPATVLAEPCPAVLVDVSGAPVGVTGRCAVTAPPAWLSVAGWVDRQEVAGWAGPWPVDERWWDAAAHRRRARFQVRPRSGPAWLLALENGRWWVEARYD